MKLAMMKKAHTTGEDFDILEAPYMEPNKHQNPISCFVQGSKRKIEETGSKVKKLSDEMKKLP